MMASSCNLYVLIYNTHLVCLVTPKEEQHIFFTLNVRVDFQDDEKLCHLPAHDAFHGSNLMPCGVFFSVGKPRHQEDDDQPRYLRYPEKIYSRHNAKTKNVQTEHCRIAIIICILFNK
eukprot:TRINITY_DN19991_c0_g1_i1.p1 TRINITY_DN19991_c0_g1~~TRINITY_DN19991_c0_g1_i1.p1  ORF type:complete len:118 (-),score=6.21 TRINITY_DN19991_c0_g1_i1:19-372(-)